MDTILLANMWTHFLKILTAFIDTAVQFTCGFGK